MNETVIGQLVTRLTGDATLYLAMLRDAQQATQQAASQINTAAQAIRGFQAQVEGFGQNALGVVGQLGIAMSAMGLATQAVKKAAASEDLRITFGVLLGSAERAGDMIERLAQLANTTPFRMPTLVDATRQLLTAGVAAEDMIPTLRLLGDISGGNAERMGLLTHAFSRIAASGRLTAYELKTLRATGFNPINELARSTGKSVEFWSEKLHKGGLTMQDFVAAMKAATGPGGRFYQFLDRSSQSLTGLSSTMLDAINGPIKLLGETLVDALNLKGVVRGVTEAARATTAFFKGVPAEVKGVAAGVIALTGAVSAMSGAWLLVGPVVLGTWANVTALLSGSVAVVRAVASGVAALVTNFAEVTATAAAAGWQTLWVAGPYLAVAAAIVVAAGAVYLFASATGSVEALNAALANSAELSERLAKQTAKEAQAARDRIKAIADPGARQTALSEELARAKKEAEGADRNVKAIQQRMGEVSTASPYNFIARAFGFRPLGDFEDSLKDARGQLKAAQSQVDELGAAVKAAQEPAKDPALLKSLADMTEHLQTHARTMNMSKEMAEFYKKGLDKLPPSMTENVRGMIQFTVAAEELKKKKKELADGTRSLREHLEDELTTLGKSADAVKLQKLVHEGLNDAQRENLRGMIQMAEARKKHDEALKAGKDIEKEMRTPLEAYNARVAELQKLYDDNAIPSQETYNRALADARKKFYEAQAAAAGARHEVERLDAVLAGGAEAVSRVIQYRERFLTGGATFPTAPGLAGGITATPAFGASPPTLLPSGPPPGAGSDLGPVVAVLKDLLDVAQGIRSDLKAGPKLKTAGLT